MSGRWFFRTAAAVGCVLLIMSLVMYAVDPLFVYRYRGTGTYWIQPEWTSTGLIKNYEYDTVLLGSSVTQNFHADEFGECVGGNVLKVNSGGLSVTETEAYVRMIEKAGKAKACYVGLDIPQFAKTKESDVNRVRGELADDNIWNDYPYLLGYEMWTRFLPVDMALGLLHGMGVDYPQRIALKTDVKRSGEWKEDFVCGKSVVEANYRNHQYSVSEVEKENLLERMKERADEYLEAFEFGGNTEYVFFFPPYSALYWHEAEQLGIFEDYMAFKAYITEKLLEKDGVVILDFQSEAYTADLDYYRDSTHYGAEVNEKMLEMFRTEENRIEKPEEIKENTGKLLRIVEKFREENEDWL